VTESPVREKSVSSTFHKALLLIYFASVLVAVPAIYYLTKDELYSQANQELKLMVDVVRSARAIVRERTRPHFLPKGEFFPPVVSSTVMAKELASQFKKVQPSYLIRMISDNPLNRENLPEGLEVAVLDQLRHSSTGEKVELTGEINGGEYLISAAPAKVKDSCLICHGDVEMAPKEIVEQYGTTSGYGWKSGSVIGASLVGVPVADLNMAVLKRAGIFIGIITVLFASVLVVLNRMVEKNIIQPILEITEIAKQVSLGRSNQPLISERNDEIGSLTRAFELMRRSVNIASKQLAKKAASKRR
jgi:HAMP domain-containing protein